MSVFGKARRPPLWQPDDSPGPGAYLPKEEENVSLRHSTTMMGFRRTSVTASQEWQWGQQKQRRASDYGEGQSPSPGDDSTLQGPPRHPSLDWPNLEGIKSSELAWKDSGISHGQTLEESCLAFLDHKVRQDGANVADAQSPPSAGFNAVKRQQGFILHGGANGHGHGPAFPAGYEGSSAASESVNQVDASQNGPPSPSASTTDATFATSRPLRADNDDQPGNQALHSNPSKSVCSSVHSVASMHSAASGTSGSMPPLRAGGRFDSTELAAQDEKYDIFFMPMPTPGGGPIASAYSPCAPSRAVRSQPQSAPGPTAAQQAAQDARRAASRLPKVSAWSQGGNSANTTDANRSHTNPPNRDFSSLDGSIQGPTRMAPRASSRGAPGDGYTSLQLAANRALTEKEPQSNKMASSKLARAREYAKSLSNRGFASTKRPGAQSINQSTAHSITSSRPESGTVSPRHPSQPGLGGSGGFSAQRVQVGGAGRNSSNTSGASQAGHASSGFAPRSLQHSGGGSKGSYAQRSIQSRTGGGSGSGPSSSSSVNASVGGQAVPGLQQGGSASYGARATSHLVPQYVANSLGSRASGSGIGQGLGSQSLRGSTAKLATYTGPGSSGGLVTDPTGSSRVARAAASNLSKDFPHQTSIPRLHIPASTNLSTSSSTSFATGRDPHSTTAAAAEEHREGQSSFQQVTADTHAVHSKSMASAAEAAVAAVDAQSQEHTPGLQMKVRSQKTLQHRETGTEHIDPTQPLSDAARGVGSAVNNCNPSLGVRLPALGSRGSTAPQTAPQHPTRSDLSASTTDAQHPVPVTTSDGVALPSHHTHDELLQALKDRDWEIQGLQVELAKTASALDSVHEDLENEVKERIEAQSRVQQLEADMRRMREQHIQLQEACNAACAARHAAEMQQGELQDMCEEALAAHDEAQTKVAKLQASLEALTPKSDEPQPVNDTALQEELQRCIACLTDAGDSTLGSGQTEPTSAQLQHLRTSLQGALRASHRHALGREEGGQNSLSGRLSTWEEEKGGREAGKKGMEQRLKELVREKEVLELDLELARESAANVEELQEQHAQELQALQDQLNAARADAAAVIQPVQRSVKGTTTVETQTEHALASTGAGSTSHQFPDQVGLEQATKGPRAFVAEATHLSKSLNAGMDANTDGTQPEPRQYSRSVSTMLHAQRGAQPSALDAQTQAAQLAEWADLVKCTSEAGEPPLSPSKRAIPHLAGQLRGALDGLHAHVQQQLQGLGGQDTRMAALLQQLGEQEAEQQLVLGAVHRELQAKLKQAAAEATALAGSPSKYGSSAPSSVASWVNANAQHTHLPDNDGPGSAPGTPTAAAAAAKAYSGGAELSRLSKDGYARVCSYGSQGMVDNEPQQQAGEDQGTLQQVPDERDGVQQGIKQADVVQRGVEETSGVQQDVEEAGGVQQGEEQLQCGQGEEHGGNRDSRELSDEGGKGEQSEAESGEGEATEEGEGTGCAGETGNEKEPAGGIQVKAVPMKRTPKRRHRVRTALISVGCTTVSLGGATTALLLCRPDSAAAAIAAMQGCAGHAGKALAHAGSQTFDAMGRAIRASFGSKDTQRRRRKHSKQGMAMKAPHAPQPQASSKPWWENKK